MLPHFLISLTQWAWQSGLSSASGERTGVSQEHWSWWLPHLQGAPGHWASVPRAQQQLRHHLSRDSVEDLQMDEQNLRAFLILRLCDLLSQPTLQGQSHPEGSAHAPSSPVHGGLGRQGWGMAFGVTLWQQ